MLFDHVTHKDPLTLDTFAGIIGFTPEEARQALIESPAASADLVLSSSLHDEIQLVPWAALCLCLRGELQGCLDDNVLTREEAQQLYNEAIQRLPGIWQSLEYALTNGEPPESWIVYGTVRGATFPLTFVQDVAVSVVTYQK